MNLLIITSSFPYPLSSGGAQAQFNMIEKLRHRYNITLLYPDNGKIKPYAQQLSALWPNVSLCSYPLLRQLANPSFLLSKIKRAIDLKLRSGNPRFLVERTLKPYGYPNDKPFFSFVNSVIENVHPDIIQIDFFPFLRLVHHLPVDIPKVFIHHEIRFVRNQRLLSGISLTASERALADKVKQNEIADLNCFNAVVTLTQVDAGILKNEGVHVPVHISPAAIQNSSRTYTGWNKKIVFIGGRSHTPNQEALDWFFKDVAPMIEWGKTSCQGLDVIGTGWAEHYPQDMHVNGLKVNFLGFVPELADFVGSILIIPILSGSGMRMKILEGAANGMPMLTTTVGVEGLLFKDGESVLVADKPTDFADQLCRLMKDSILRKSLTSKAKDIYDSNYSAPALVKIREAVYEEVAGSKE